MHPLLGLFLRWVLNISCSLVFHRLIGKTFRRFECHIKVLFVINRNDLVESIRSL
jgi:hypothetical protein